MIGSATAQQILNKNNEAWKSFFALLKLRKKGELPPFITKVNPPGYRKKAGRRMLWTALRKDQYRIEGNKLILKGLGAIGRIELGYKGPIHLKGGAVQTGDTLLRQGKMVCAHSIRNLGESCWNKQPDGFIH